MSNNLDCKELNYLVSNKAEILIVTNDDKNQFKGVEFLVKSFTTPKISVSSNLFSVNGNQLKFNSDVISFDDFSFTFYVDDNCDNYNAIENYIFKCNDNPEHIQDTFEIVINIYNSNDILVKTITLANCVFNELGGSKIDYTTQTKEAMAIDCSVSYSHIKKSTNINYN